MVENEDVIDSEISDGIKLDFDFAFKIFNSSDIKVYKQQIDDSFLLLSEVSDWTPGLPPGSGVYWLEFDTAAETGTIHLSEAANSGRLVCVVRNTTPTQETTFAKFNPYTVKATENALDKLTLLVQELDHRLSRAALVPELPISTDQIVLGDRDEGKMLKWEFDIASQKWYLNPSVVDVDDIAEYTLAAAASAGEAAVSAAAAAASAGLTELSGTLLSRPDNPGYNTFYWATDVSQYYRYSVNAARWFLLG